MTPNSLISVVEQKNYIKLFDALPGSNMLLQTNAPHYTILAATPQHLNYTGISKEDLIGKDLFVAYPANPNDLNDTGASDLRSSLEHVLRHKEQHQLAVQRYDVADKSGNYSQKYWSATNSPVFDDGGEVTYIIHTTEDITDRVKAGEMKERMKGMEQAYTVFNQTPVPICILKGPDLIVEMANDPALQLWGKTKEVVGLPLEQAVAEVKGQGFIEIINEVREKGIPNQIYESPVTLVRNGKQEIAFVNYIYHPYYEENSTIAAGVLTIGQDVTEQVVNRKQLEQSEDRYYNLIHSSPFAIGVLMGPNLVVTTGNEAMLNLWGKGKSVFGKPFFEALPELTEQGYRDVFNTVYFSGKAANFVETPVHILQNGQMTLRYYNFILYPQRNGGSEVEGVGIIASEVTPQAEQHKQLKESEERFRTLADESPLFVFIIDADPMAPVSYWNKTWLDYTGQSLEEAIGRAWDGIIHPDDVAIVMEHYIPAFKAHTMYLIPAVRVKRYDGEYRWHSFKGNPRYLATGDFNGYVGVGFDVHEQKMVEEKLEELVGKRTEQLQFSNEELIRSNRNLEQFAYAASHDLKEPIRKIHVFSQRIKVSLGERMWAAEKQYFERMEVASRRMSTLIDDLLTYSEVTQKAGLKETVDMNQLLNEVLSDLDLDIEQKAATIKIDTLFTTTGHKRHLQQAFGNLIGNSLKYTKPNLAPVITITSSKVKGFEAGIQLSGTHLQREFNQIVIRDNGIGFEQENAERIFNVFTRLHGVAEYKGTGVGLSIVRKVIENHNGYIWAESEPGEGATFKVLLPCD